MSAFLLAVVAWSAQCGAVVVAAGIAVAGAGVRAPRARLALWQAALVAALVAPLAAAAFLRSPAPAFGGGALATVVAGGAVAAGGLSADTWSSVAVACLLAGMAFRAAWVIAGWRHLHRWTAVEAASSPLFDEAAAEIGVQARLVCADGIGSPFTFGCRAPVIVADARLLEDPRTARAVFLHELEHVARRDWAFVIAEEILRIALWFHPAAWWATAEMRIAREEIVDRAAASRLGSRREYLEALLSVGPAGEPGWQVAPALARRRQLARRIRSLAMEVPMSTRHTLLAIVVVAAGVTGAAYAAAGTFPVWSPPAATAGSLPDDNVEKPVPTRKVEAVYPPEAKEKHVEGNVELLVRVGADGLVKEATVEKSVALLDEAALTAIKQWEFRAGRVNGKPVEVLTTITFSFRLK